MAIESRFSDTERSDDAGDKRIFSVSLSMDCAEGPGFDSWCRPNSISLFKMSSCEIARIFGVFTDAYDGHDVARLQMQKFRNVFIVVR